MFKRSVLLISVIKSLLLIFITIVQYSRMAFTTFAHGHTQVLHMATNKPTKEKQMLRLTLKPDNYSFMLEVASSNSWSLASTVSRVTQYLEQYKSGKITVSQYLTLINNL